MLAVGDTIKCRDAEDMVDTMFALQQEAMKQSLCTRRMEKRAYGW